MEPILIGVGDTSYTIWIAMASDLAKPDQMVILHDVEVELADLRTLLLPGGFITDCHSTPACIQFILPAYDNKTNIAAISHDRLYMDFESYLLEYPELSVLKESAARLYADGVYLELMERFNRGHWKNRIYYAGVRLFGWWNWRKFRKRNFISLARARNSIEADRAGRIRARSALIRRLRTK